MELNTNTWMLTLPTKKLGKKLEGDIMKRGGEPSYPTIIVDDRILITGFLKDNLEQALEV